MDNLIRVLEIFFKEVSVEQILDQEITYNCFNIENFLRLGNTHMKYYSNNELENLYKYLENETSIFRRHIYGIKENIQEKHLNVFDILFMFSDKTLTEDGQEPVCRYAHLDEWRKMSLSLGGDIFIAAYYASKDAYHIRERKRFFWKNALSTDNIHLKRILERGIAENHFHLKGSAPSFDISWISLMNHILDYPFRKKLEEIDNRRLHHTVNYDYHYIEKSLWVQVLEAALIRVFLYGILIDKPLLMDSTQVNMKKLESRIKYERISDDIIIQRNKVIDIYKKKNAEKLSLGDIFKEELNEKNYNEKLYSFFQNKVGKNEITKSFYENVWKRTFFPKSFFEEWKEQNIDFRSLLKASIPYIQNVKLKFLENLLDEKEYHKLCENEGASYVYELLKNPKRFVEEAGNIQKLISMTTQDISAFDTQMEEHQYTKLDYFLYPILKEVKTVPGYKALLSGERYFLYRYLKYAYIREPKMEKHLNLFYRYLIIKNRIWDELIQTNGNIGFNNFLRYQDRKEDFVEDTIYEDYYLQMAIAGTMTTQSIKKLEARITPKNNSYLNYKTIMKQRKIIQNALEEEFLDKTIFSRIGAGTEENEVAYMRQKAKDKISQYMNSFFYVYHFIKEADEKILAEADGAELRCRHYNKRKQIYIQSRAIAELREHYPQAARHVFGIDAASEEILCRPEVFAQAFRYLRNHIVYDEDALPELRWELPNLKVTYHAGEDFLDIIDGLRAIDEAIYFLDMQCGDRIGHALALGIDVKEWYASKNNKVVLSQQEYLDNLVWLYGKIRKFRLKDFQDVVLYIEKEFDEYIRIVYLDYINEDFLESVVKAARKESGRKFFKNHYNFDINAYYDSWKLRCDNPESYRKGFFEECDIDSSWDEYSVNKKYPSNYKIRYNLEAAFLYFSYHYNPDVKKIGADKIEKEIPYNMIRCVVEVQKKMQELVARKGLGIECNPSSNCLIGTFHKYKDHPISHFCNKGLVVEPQKLLDCPQISVSINTDDQGVFYTSLENEFALMALSMEEARDIDGNLLYNRTRVFDWLDEIRKMGLIQSFKD